MKINNLSLTGLSNEEHFKFQTDVNGLIQFFTAATLMIAAEYESFSTLIADEEQALNFVRKSTISDLIQAADAVRDNTLNGMDDAIKSKLKHFNVDVKNAATRLKVMRDTIGNITLKAYDKESGAIIKLLADLKGSYAADVAKAGIGEWVVELEANQNAFDALTIERYDEKDAKTGLRMKEVRIQMDADYRKIAEKVNALIVVYGETAYAPFVSKLNLRIESYSNNMAVRKSKTITPVAPAAPVV
jgi:hypothetical protein